MNAYTSVQAPDDKPLKVPDDLGERLAKWEAEDDNHWSGWRKQARESFAFVAGEQYSKDEKNELEAAGRRADSINRIGPMVNAVAGAEIIDRQQVQYIPRTTGDSGVNELLTMGAEWIREQCLADQEESDAFRDVLICGLGYTDTSMNYDDEPEGKIVIDRLDPLEVIPDAAARKPNLRDARRFRRRKKISREDFEREYPGKTPEDGPTARSSGSNWKKPQDRFAIDGDQDDVSDDELHLTEWQWWEFKPVTVIKHPATGQLVDLTDEEWKEAQALGATADMTVKQRRKVFYRAVCCGGNVLRYEELADGEFTIKALTGERNRNKGTWYGIVEAMKDPQKFANLFFSMLHHIIRTNAKGGVMAETDAFVDPKKAQESWARSDAITWMKPGGIGKIKPKDAPQIPVQMTQLLQFAVEGIKDASGINEELLGLVGRDQPGVLEHQRKQAAYAILAGYYDSLRFYRKEQGGLLLKYMQKYLAPNGYLVRIAGEDGNPRYLPLVQHPDTIKFDVIVDDAPAGPNQKERVWALISNMQAMLAEAGPEVWAELIDYSPFPDKVNRALKETFKRAAQPDPAAQQAAQADAAATIGGKQAKMRKDNADAAQTEAETAMMMGPTVIPFPQAAG